MLLPLIEILKLVGPLDDAPGENTARERLRAYLKDSVKEAGVVRDYIETCINTSGPQYARALQDLVNHCGFLLGFAVEFGRYQGIHTEIGNDGLWRSPTGISLVVEVKTTDAFAIQTATLLGYIDKLVAEKKIPDRDHTLGLYVVGRLEASLGQLTDSITAQKLTHQLRVASVDTILSLLELMEDVDLTHEEVLAILRPGGPVIDEIVKVLARVAAQGPVGLTDSETAVEPRALASVADVAADDNHLFLLTPVTDDEKSTAENVIRGLLDQGWYVFGDRTPGRKKLKAGDRLCFYRTGTGVVAKAIVASTPKKRVVEGVRHPERSPWAFRVKDVRYFFETPRVIDASLRSQLDAFKERDPN